METPTLSKRRVCSWTGTPDNDSAALIRYAGAKVAVVVVAVTGGYYKPGLGYQDVLCREEKGPRFYLVRETQGRNTDDGPPPQRGCGRGGGASSGCPCAARCSSP